VNRVYVRPLSPAIAQESITVRHTTTAFVDMIFCGRANNANNQSQAKDAALKKRSRCIHTERIIDAHWTFGIDT
jgi:hypothetical protein